MMTTHNYQALGFKEEEVKMLTDFDKAVSKTEGGWEFMRTFADKSFVWASGGTIDKINENISYSDHSGSTYEWTARRIQRVAKEGWETFVKNPR
jgi:hypothetical protein